MEIMVYSLLWVMRDLYHQPCGADFYQICSIVSALQQGFRGGAWMEDAINCLGQHHSESQVSARRLGVYCTFTMKGSAEDTCIYIYIYIHMYIYRYLND